MEEAEGGEIHEGWIEMGICTVPMKVDCVVNQIAITLM